MLDERYFGWLASGVFALSAFHVAYCRSTQALVLTGGQHVNRTSPGFVKGTDVAREEAENRMS